MNALDGDEQGNLLWMAGLQWTGDDETGHPATCAEGASVYAAAAAAIFPCRGKEPATVHGFKDAAPDAAPWSMNPDFNIGWPLPAGWWALDVDPRHQGDLSLRELEREHGPLPMTLRQVTGSGGAHWIFRNA